MSTAPMIGQPLDVFLSGHTQAPLARLLSAIAVAARPLAHVIRRGPFVGDFGKDVGPAKHDDVAQKALDIFAEDVFIDGLGSAGVRAVLSEERDEPIVLSDDGAFLVALDPLDGSSNIGVNSSIGTLFSAIDAPGGAFETQHFLQPGVRQRAAGFLLYGPQVVFVFTAGTGVHMATLDPDADAFRMSRIDACVPTGRREFGINASNSRHWPAPVRAYIDDCLEGEDGPRGGNFNMRWVGAVVADVYRILIRGGVYLYPEDLREGYQHGRLRLLYEGNPIALLIEQAGGGAIDGFQRILELEPRSLHMRTPLIFGSKDKIERVARYYSEGNGSISAPLFMRRTLLRR